jgi:hypothetical protein
LGPRNSDAPTGREKQLSSSGAKRPTSPGYCDASRRIRGPTGREVADDDAEDDADADDDVDADADCDAPSAAPAPFPSPHSLGTLAVTPSRCSRSSIAAGFCCCCSSGGGSMTAAKISRSSAFCSALLG